MRVLTVAVCVCLALGAQQERPAFRTTTRLVEFTVVALDKKGNPVTDLKQDELVVEEKSRVFRYPDVLERDMDTSMEQGLVHDELRSGSEPEVEVHRIDDEVKVITELPGLTRDTLPHRERE